MMHSPHAVVSDRWSLVILASGGSARTLSLAEGSWVAGRDTEAGLWVDDATLSRRHFMLQHDASGALFVSDLGSANGTQVDGERLSPSTSGNGRPLEGGEVITAGQTRILVVAGDLHHAQNRLKQWQSEAGHGRRTRWLRRCGWLLLIVALACHPEVRVGAVSLASTVRERVEQWLAARDEAAIVSAAVPDSASLMPTEEAAATPSADSASSVAADISKGSSTSSDDRRRRGLALAASGQWAEALRMLEPLRGVTAGAETVADDERDAAIAVSASSLASACDGDECLPEAVRLSLLAVQVSGPDQRARHEELYQRFLGRCRAHHHDGLALHAVRPQQALLHLSTACLCLPAHERLHKSACRLTARLRDSQTATRRAG